MPIPRGRPLESRNEGGAGGHHRRPQLFRSPRFRGEGHRAERGGGGRRGANAPPPPFGWSPSPALAGEDFRSIVRRAGLFRDGVGILADLFLAELAVAIIGHVG